MAIVMSAARKLLLHHTSDVLQNEEQHIYALTMHVLLSTMHLTQTFAQTSTSSNVKLKSAVVYIAAMDRAIDKYLQDNHANDDAHLLLWPEEAVQLLLFTCTKDPSVRLRRAAMSLLTSVVSRQQSAQEADIIRTLILKCRDKDNKVQTQAYQMLEQLPADTLKAHLKLEDWRAVLDTALLSKQADCSDHASGNEQSEVQKLGTDLLHKYLKTEEVLPLLHNIGDAAWLSIASDGVSTGDTALSALGLASQHLQALQLPWHNSTVHEAYCSALLNHTY